MFNRDLDLCTGRNVNDDTIVSFFINAETISKECTMEVEDAVIEYLTLQSNEPVINLGCRNRDSDLCVNGKAISSHVSRWTSYSYSNDADAVFWVAIGVTIAFSIFIILILIFCNGFCSCCCCGGDDKT